MASLGHVAVGVLASRVLGSSGDRTRTGGTVAALAGLSLLPDLDYLGVMLGVTDAGPCGHRGATHSLMTPLLVGLVAIALAPRFRLQRWRAGLVCFAVVGSHALLDAMTVGSRGVPLFWPFSFARYEMPWRPIPNAPCGLAYISREGLRVAVIEFFQFMPLLIVGLWPARAPRAAQNRPPETSISPGRIGVRVAGVGKPAS